MGEPGRPKDPRSPGTGGVRQSPREGATDGPQRKSLRRPQPRPGVPDAEECRRCPVVPPGTARDSRCCGCRPPPLRPNRRDEATFIEVAERLNSRIRRYNHEPPAAGSVFGVPTSSTALQLHIVSIPAEVWRAPPNAGPPEAGPYPTHSRSRVATDPHVTCAPRGTRRGTDVHASMNTGRVPNLLRMSRVANSKTASGASRCPTNVAPDALLSALAVVESGRDRD